MGPGVEMGTDRLLPWELREVCLGRLHRELSRFWLKRGLDLMVINDTFTIK